ncbi:helix-hairpin-helix domain-containing protein [Aquimarina sp. 2201CG5-10]|uniref:ComEA family DNA-binding protein n=1 Tax=Aquimarina callyspongiae TaxID=3098150 RepID=UPI002AB39CE3|nr:helix-hairpin-helix domain-containing protein [Aquimarina sp. 2201CG5-10]MDY8138515.1 helix-hairpin-helix domain-containing protein [Aquimarina sp. 2201CG5-10]
MHKRFRNGIFLLVIVLFTLMAIYYFYPSMDKGEKSFVELNEFQEQIDSLKEVALNKKTAYKQKPFNPNFISDYKGYALGLSAEEIDKIYAYRKQGKWINSVADFKKVTGVSDSILNVISPLFKFPDWINNSTAHKSNKRKYPIISDSQKGDLNTVTAKELQEKINVPDFIAVRIVKLRNDLGGFSSDIQLKDVYGLYESQRKKILGLYTTKTPKEIHKINLNKASVKELMEIPYFDFETALEIKDFIEENGGISDFKELRKIEEFSIEKIDRIELYLTLK